MIIGDSLSPFERSGSGQRAAQASALGAHDVGGVLLEKIMGIQAFINMADLQAAATDIRVHTMRVPSHDEDMHPSLTWQEVEVQLEGAEEPLWFNLSGDGSVAWIDVNHWGSNRSRYLPALAKAGVEWVEG